MTTNNTSAIAILISYAESLGMQILEREKCTLGACFLRRNGKFLLTFRKVEVYILLHELGHAINCMKGETPHAELYLESKKAHKYRTQAGNRSLELYSDEVLAWHTGAEIAAQLGVELPSNFWIKAAICLRTYELLPAQKPGEYYAGRYSKKQDYVVSMELGLISPAPKGLEPDPRDAFSCW